MRPMPALSPVSRLAGLSALFVAIWLSGCGKKEQPVFATLTMKSGGGHFSGTVVRQEKSSITLIGPDGNPRTFLYAELAGPVQYNSPTAPETAGPATDHVSSGSSSSQGQNATDRLTPSKPLEVSAAFEPDG